MKKSLEALFTTPTPQSVRRFYWVDVVRGCAALVILVWHYQHFYYQTAGQNPILDDRDVQPFYSFLSLFYNQGFFAVQLFWVISGFVFASVYAAKPVSGRDFFVNRFARLYPLHFATLVIVAALQGLSFLLQQEHQIYANNDAYHFVLNLFLVSQWGFENGDSFNAPIWSVSVEMFIYIVFWLVHRWLFRRGIVGPLLLTVIFGLLLALHAPGQFWECGFLFFLGASAFVWVAQIQDRNYVSSAAALLGLVTASFLLIRDIDGLGYVLRAIFFVSLVVLAASLDQRDTRQYGTRIAAVGDISFSVYLLHVPVQITLILLMDQLGVDRRIVSTHGFFLFFIVLMLVVAHFSYRKFELPMRHWLRNHFRRTQEPLPWRRVGLSKD